MNVPIRLQKNTKEIKIKNGHLKCLIKCSNCNCDKFIAYKYSSYNSNSNKELGDFIKKHPLLSYKISRDKNGITYLQGTTVFDIPITKRIYFNDTNNDSRCHIIIKACCSNCKNEIIVFDSETDGYDAIIENKVKHRKEIQEFKKINTTPQNIVLEIYNDNSFEEFKENTGLENLKDYYSGFGAIKISLINVKNRRKKIILEEETR